jgi:N-acetylneuraminate synthase
MTELRERYQVPVGLSDHSGRIYPSLAAITLGANLLEVHVTLSREMFGPDVPASLTPKELRQTIEGARFIEDMLSAPVDKTRLATEKAGLRSQFFHSVVANEDLRKGIMLERRHLATKKPGTGIPAERVNEIVGRKLSRDVKKDQLLAEEDLVQ